tara:strand:+ start:60 stop:317 length:258 start_codon:yes stop_codon:yes gene_type:complete
MNLQERYQEYLSDFDPTPQYLYDEPYSPLEYEEWVEKSHPEMLTQLTYSQLNDAHHQTLVADAHTPMWCRYFYAYLEFITDNDHD